MRGTPGGNYSTPLTNERGFLSLRCPLAVLTTFLWGARWLSSRQRCWLAILFRSPRTRSPLVHAAHTRRLYTLLVHAALYLIVASRVVVPDTQPVSHRCHQLYWWYSDVMNCGLLSDLGSWVVRLIWLYMLFPSQVNVNQSYLDKRARRFQYFIVQKQFNDRDL
jgi:hypothetical protein